MAKTLVNESTCYESNGVTSTSTEANHNIKCHMSSDENPVDIPLNPGWLIGILILAYYDPHIVGKS